MGTTKTQAFDAGVKDLLTAIDLCYKKRHVLPALMLLYSTLDVMAALDRPPDPKPSGSSKPARTTRIGKQFVAWIDEFMKPGISLKATPEEIWAWRNGLVHTYSVDSDATRAGTARRAYYCYGTGQLSVLRQMPEVRARKAVPVKVDHMIAALKTAIKRFREALAKDPRRAEKVYTRAAKQFYLHIEQPTPRA